MASSKEPVISTRKQTEIWLVGQISQTLLQTKLPSKRETLSVFFYYKDSAKQTIREAARSTSKDVLDIWNKARIPTQQQIHIVDKIEKLFKEWQNLKKNKENKSKRSDGLKLKEDMWSNNLDDLFDVAHANALQMIRIQEDKDFLLAQREKGRPGKMGGVDKRLSKKEEMKERKKARMELFKAKESEFVSSITSISDTDSLSSDEESVHGEEDHIYGPSTSSEGKKPNEGVKKRGRKKLLNEKLATSLDVAKISDRKAALVLTSTLNRVGCDPTEYNLNFSSIRRQRLKCRQNIAENIKKDFNTDVPLTVHWDGKMLEDITGQEVVDRLPVLISGKGVDQLLCIPKLQSGEGEKIASAVYESLVSWGLLDKVKSMSFDTTASNTGSRKGACILLEQKMDKELLWLACRHHIMEIMLESVVQNEIGPSSGPDNLLFKRFQKNWQSINKEEYLTLITDKESMEKLQDKKDEIIEFATEQLTEYQPRDDYKELLQLSILFLGGELENGVSFKKPAGLHRARWMAKSIYSLKIFLFREQFRLTKHEERGLREICIFTVLIYIKYWFQAPSASSAPRNDLELLKDLKNYEKVNPVIARKAMHKVCGHLWYVSEELVALSFFDDKVTNETKNKMVEALKKEGVEFCPKRIVVVDVENIRDKNLEDFVTSNTKRFFSITGMSSDFLKKKVEDWINDKEYINSKEIVTKLKVVNDTAERGVSLIQEYNKILTLNEDQKQYILLLVKSFRQKFPNYKKATLLTA